MPNFGIWLAKFFDPNAKIVYPLLNKKVLFNNERMRSILGVEPRDVATTVLDTCYNVIEFGVVPKKNGYLGRRDTRTDKKQDDTTADTGGVDSSNKNEEVMKDNFVGQVNVMVTNEAEEKEEVEGSEVKETKEDEGGDEDKKEEVDVKDGEDREKNEDQDEEIPS